jgi:hypothetical protein
MIFQAEKRYPGSPTGVLDFSVGLWAIAVKRKVLKASTSMGRPKKNGPKKEHTSFGMLPQIKAKALLRANSLGFENSFSAYVNKLIMDDLKRAELE